MADNDAQNPYGDVLDLKLAENRRDIIDELTAPDGPFDKIEKRLTGFETRIRALEDWKIDILASMRAWKWLPSMVAAVATGVVTAVVIAILLAR